MGCYCSRHFHSVLQTTCHPRTREDGCSSRGPENEKYQGLPPGHMFLPIAVKTLGAISPRVTGPPEGAGTSHWRGVGRAQINRVPAAEAVSGGSVGELYFCTGQYGPLTLPFLPCLYLIFLLNFFIFINFFKTYFAFHCTCVGNCLTAYT